MHNRFRWWVSAALTALIVVSFTVPILAQAQETSGGLQTAPVAIDVAIKAEPSADSADLEWLAAGTMVTLMEAAQVSPADGQEWVLVASLQSMGYLPLAALASGSEQPETQAPEPLPVIVRWQAITSAVETLCLSEPREDAGTITILYQGEEIGLTAEPVDGWQAVICAEQAGFVPTWIFDPPAPPDPVDTPNPVDTGEPPAAETPVVTETPISTETAIPPTETPAPATETATSAPVEATPAAPAGTEEPAEEDLVEVAALTAGIGFVSGTDGDGVRCRATASSSGATITILQEGVSVTVRGGSSGGWQPVVCAGRNGFVWDEYLSESSSGSGSGGGTGMVRNSDGDGVRCRATASYSGPVITVLSPGASASIRGATQGGWVPVVCAGRNGFVHSDFFGAGSGSGSGSSSGFSSGQSVRVAGTDGDGVRFRSSASYSGAVIAVLAEGAGLIVRSGSVGDWIALTRNGSNGYIHRDFLAQGAGSSGNGSVGSSNIAVGSNARVTDTLRLRSGASFSSATRDIAPTGAVVRITGSPSNGFYAVRWDDLHGYMHRDFLVWTSQGLSDRSSSPGTTTPVGNAGSGSGSGLGRAMVNYALRYLGYPYVWAGRGPTQFDCAGFVYWVAINTVGVNLVGGVINQWTYGRPVPYGQLQAGDIVYFQNTYQPGLSHIGIYIGNNQFVHASNPTDGVIISNLTNSYYSTRWYGARRII